MKGIGKAAPEKWKQFFETSTAYHEAGHAVAQIYYFGGGIDRVHIQPSKDIGGAMIPSKRHQTVRAYRKVPGKDAYVATNGDPNWKLETLVSLAGFAADYSWREWARFDGEFPEHWFGADYRNDTDRKNAKAALSRQKIKDADRVLTALGSRVCELFADHTNGVWSAVELIAEELLVRRTIDGDEATLLIKITLGRRLRRAEAKRAEAFGFVALDSQGRYRNLLEEP